MLHASETWPLTKPNLQRMQRNDRAMIRQICNVKPQDIVTTRSNELLAWLGIEDLDLILKERSLSWYGHVEHSNGAVKTAFDLQVVGKRGPGKPNMTWKQLTERDCREWKLSAIDPHDRHTWRSGVRSAMRAASQLPQGDPLMWMLSLYLHVNQKSVDDDDDDDDELQIMQIQISWLLQKPTDLALHCLQRQVYPGSAGQGFIHKALEKNLYTQIKRLNIVANLIC